MRIGLACILLMAALTELPWAASDTGKQTVFRVPVDVVVVNATVVDKDGKPVTDLTAEDFQVFEDGKPQDIQTFALEAYGGQPATASNAPEREALERNLERPRMVSLVIDDLTMESVESFPRMIEAIREYVSNEMTSRDQVTILSGSGRVQVPYSNNRRKLLDELAAIPDRLNLVPPSRSTCPKLNDLVAFSLTDLMERSPIYKKPYIDRTMQCTGLDEGGAETYLRSVAEQQRQMIENANRRMLQTLRQHVRVLRRFEGDKTVVFLSDGLLCEPERPEAYQLQQIVDLALRSRIVFSAVSLRSIATGYDLSESRYFSPPNQLARSNTVEEDRVSMSRTGWDADSEMNRRAKESPLSQLAEATGGAFSPGRNDLRLGLEEVARHKSYYYVLSYSVPAHKANGAYHKIKLELNRPGLKLSYRKGYYVQKEEMQYETSRREDIIEALNAPGDLKELPMTLSYNYSQVDDALYAVSFVTRAVIDRVPFSEEDGRRTNTISLVLAAFDENDKFIEGVDKSVEFHLLEESYANLRKRGMTSKVELKLPMGRYKVKAVVRENNQGKVGSVSKSVEIP